MSTPYDLRALFRKVGRVPGQGRIEVSPAERIDAAVDVEMLEKTPLRLTDVEPLDVIGFVDGVQNRILLNHIDHRPVQLFFVAAAAVNRGPDGRPIVMGLQEELQIACHESAILAPDGVASWMKALDTAIPFASVPDGTPPEVENAIYKLVGEHRDSAERAVVKELLGTMDGNLVVDGTLIGRPQDSRLFGVVKTVNRRWMPDESILWTLPENWRSPRFRIPASKSGPERYSCYVRLRSNENASWAFGLVRLEAFDAEQLDSLAALCVAEKQPARSGDPRGDRHLEIIRLAEDVLRSRRPAVFDM